MATGKKVRFGKTKTEAEVTATTPEKWIDTGTLSREEEKDVIRFTIDIPTELHTRIKTYCAAKRVKMRDVIQELLEDKFPPVNR